MGVFRFYVSRESESCSTHLLGFSHLRLLGLCSRKSLSCDKEKYIYYIGFYMKLVILFFLKELVILSN